MSALVTTDRLDHVHLFVADRPAAVEWYARVLDLHPVGGDDPDPHHPLFLAPLGSSRLCLSLFIGENPNGAHCNVAFHCDADGFLDFARRLPADDLMSHSGAALQATDANDFGAAYTFDFRDPGGNYLELVTYDTGPVRAGLAEMA